MSPSARTLVPVTVNGVVTQLAAGTTVAALVGKLDRSPAGVAVAIDDEVVPRSGWMARQLRAGERVEILTAVQGG